MRFKQLVGTFLLCVLLSATTAVYTKDLTLPFAETGTANGTSSLFEVTNNVPEFKNNEVFALLADRDGSLWIDLYAGGPTLLQSI